MLPMVSALLMFGWSVLKRSLIGDGAFGDGKASAIRPLCIDGGVILVDQKALRLFLVEHFSRGLTDYTGTTPEHTLKNINSGSCLAIRSASIISFEGPIRRPIALEATMWMLQTMRRHQVA